MVRQYLLDTNVLIDMFKGNQRVQERIFRAEFRNCHVSEITLAELYVGAFKGGRPKQLQEIGFVCKRFHLVPITSSLDRYARLRVNLENKGLSIDDFDLLIAATALTEGFTLVTHNLRHFERIEGLRTEDWDRMAL
ncbi:MAG: PIN domain-containing protein [Bacteroidales bacterium]|nr:PIN domain-containing protein [Bacteroidales bacterium]